MSSVTMCDFCMATTRAASEFKKVKLPPGAVPEALESVGTGAERAFDACGGCLVEIASALDGLLVRRITGAPEVGDA